MSKLATYLKENEATGHIVDSEYSIEDKQAQRQLKDNKELLDQVNKLTATAEEYVMSKPESYIASEVCKELSIVHKTLQTVHKQLVELVVV